MNNDPAYDTGWLDAMMESMPEPEPPDGYPDDFTVDTDQACPDCHEARPDFLEWDEEGEYVTCLTCGCVYVPA